MWLVPVSDCMCLTSWVPGITDLGGRVHLKRDGTW